MIEDGFIWMNPASNIQSIHTMFKIQILDYYTQTALKRRHSILETWLPSMAFCLVGVQFITFPKVHS